MTTLFITGSGHLATMLAQAAGVLAIGVIVFPPDGETSESIVTSREARLRAFGMQVFAGRSVITLSDNDMSPDDVRILEAAGAVVYPSSKVLEQVWDRVLQLRTMQAAGIDVPRFRPVQAATDVMAAVEEFGFPLMLKTRYFSHAGSVVIRRSAEVPAALESLQGHDLYAQEFISFVRELAVTVVRTGSGDMQFYPVVEVVRQNQVYHTVRCPAAIDEATAYQATEMAKRAMEAVDGVGVYGIELFELEGNAVKYHKIVPYPHDAGLYTIEGTTTSQFANHVRVILGLPPGDVYQIAPATVTLALVPDRATNFSLESVRDMLATGGTQVHVYRSGSLSAGQVAGHITILGYDTDGAEKVGLLALSRIRW